MQSKTSCFNRTVFTKTLRRFWPLWLGYGAVWFLALPLSVIRAGVEGDSSLQLQRGILEIAAAASPLLLFAFSVLTAMAAFGWLYQSRSASFTAALPREHSSSKALRCKAAERGRAAANSMACSTGTARVTTFSRASSPV